MSKKLVKKGAVKQDVKKEEEVKVSNKKIDTAVESTEKSKKIESSAEGVVKLNPPKGFGEKDFRADTGTRFAHDSARQLAFDNVMKFAKEGKKLKDIRKEVALIRQENGAKHNLDAAYVNFVIATHPEFFEVYSDGTIKVVKEPTIDVNALAKSKEKIDRMKQTSKKVKKARSAASKAKDAKEAKETEEVAEEAKVKKAVKKEAVQEEKPVEQKEEKTKKKLVKRSK